MEKIIFIIVNGDGLRFKLEEIFGLKPNKHCIEDIVLKL